MMTRKNQNTDDYISAFSGDVAALLKQLRGFVHATLPGATEGMQYGVPVFLNAHGVPVIYLLGSKRNHVNFGFLRSAELTDPNGILTGSGTPSKHIRVIPGQPVDEDTLAAFVKQCEDIGS